MRTSAPPSSRGGTLVLFCSNKKKFRALPRPLRLSLAVLYRAGYLVHHKLFLRPGEPLRHAQVVIVGAYSIGGAGKTPFCIWLAKMFAEKGKKVAVLCHSAAQDEFCMLRVSLPNCTIYSTSNRYATAHEIDNLYDIILCDDGFEDSRFRAEITICMNWGEIPRNIADIFPAGKFRSFPKDHDNVDLTLNCAEDEYGRTESAEEVGKAYRRAESAGFSYNRTESAGDAKNAPDIKFSICGFKNVRQGALLEAGCIENATLVAGIGDPQRFFKDAERAGLRAEATICMRDHDPKISRTVPPLLEKGNVVVTEKDFYRLDTRTRSAENLFIAMQSVSVSDNAKKKLETLFPGVF